MVGRQTFLILSRISESTTYHQLQIHQEASKKLSFNCIKGVKATKSCIAGRQNVHIDLCWAAVVPTLRTTGQKTYSEGAFVSIPS